MIGLQYSRACLPGNLAKGIERASFSSQTACAPTTNMSGNMDAVNTETLRKPFPLHSRGYQLEMLEAGMRRNVVVAARSTPIENQSNSF